MKTQLYKIVALFLISLFYLTACQKVNPAGGGELILPPDFGDDLAPAWSPDGSTIAFTHRPVAEDTSGGPFGIYFINSDGTGRRLFLLGGHSPAWSPDGRQLVFARFETPFSSPSIYKANLKGAGLTQLTKPLGKGDDHGFPTYSHAGDRIAFSSLKKGIVIIDADGKNEKRIFKKLSAHPSWSPDDQYLVFEGPTETPPIPLPFFFNNPAWHPDDKWIAHVNHCTIDYSYDNGTLWIINIKTGEKMQLNFPYIELT